MKDTGINLPEDWWRGEGYDHCEHWTKEAVLNWFGDRGHIFTDEDGDEITNAAHLEFKIIKNFIFIVMIELCGRQYDVVLFELDSMCAEEYMSWPIKDFSWERKDLINLLYKMKLIKKEGGV